MYILHYLFIYDTIYIYTLDLYTYVYIYDIWHILVCLYIGSMKVCETSDNLGTEMVPDAAVGFYWISRFCWYFLIFFAESASRFLAIYYRSA